MGNQNAKRTRQRLSGRRLHQGRGLLVKVLRIKTIVTCCEREKIHPESIKKMTDLLNLKDMKTMMPLLENNFKFNLFEYF